MTRTFNAARAEAARPDLRAFDHVLGVGGFGDVDGLYEWRGSHVLLGGDGPTMSVERIQVIAGGKSGPVEPCTREQFDRRLAAWKRHAGGRP